MSTGNDQGRRWVIPALVAVGVALIVLAASVLVLSRYAPLTTTDASAIDAPAGPAVTVPYGKTRLQSVLYVDRATMRYSFVLHNKGSVGVTVTGFDMAHGPSYLVRPVGYAVGGSTVAQAAGPTARFHSFGLGGGSNRVVTVTLEFVNCQRISPRSGTNLEHITVHYRGLGLVPRSQRVTFPDLVRIGSPANDNRCPHVTAGSRPPG
ncbi:MAG: hypothetical protein QOG53_779 [Frankiales bacterium]|nr:hypothetical protein [Frankiales bacterium]